MFLRAFENLDRSPSAAIYKGTVNDPTTFPPPSKSHGSYHWAFERLLSAGLVPLTAAAFVTSGTNYPILDGVLGVSLIMHSHIGVGPPFEQQISELTQSLLQFDSILVDYVHKRKFPILGPVATWTLRSLTVGVLVGVYSFNTNDVGAVLFVSLLPLLAYPLCEKVSRSSSLAYGTHRRIEPDVSSSFVEENKCKIHYSPSHVSCLKDLRNANAATHTAFDASAQ
ncbi:hypothetical protein HWV62_13419 [Athelia sp. TMB]|nr:hypothetical protein HWV62_13419 [Athelia sp. TMB]